jgi:hypothetical protein
LGVEVKRHAFLTSAPDWGECSACPISFIPGKRAPASHWIGVRVGPRANMDAVAKRKKKITSLGWSGFDSRQHIEISFFATASILALGPAQSPIQWPAGALSPGIKGPGREVDHSTSSSAEIKNAWSYTSIPPLRFHGTVLSHNRNTETTYSCRDLNSGRPVPQCSTYTD